MEPHATQRIEMDCWESLNAGLVVVLVTPSDSVTNSTPTKRDNSTTAVTLSNSTSFTSNVSASTVSMTTNNSTNAPNVTEKEGGNTTDGEVPTTIMPTRPKQTPKPDDDKKSTAVPTEKDDQEDKGRSTPPGPAASAGDSTGIVILIVIIIVALICGIACFFARSRGRRYSVDLTSRHDEANIPLSTVEPELPINAVPQNGLQTFESIDMSAKESQESEMKPKAQEEQKADADKSEPSADPAAPAPSPDSSEDKPKGDVVEPSPPAPVEPSADDKTDDEGAISTKTSVESLKETNNNNSNNADLSKETDLMSGNNLLDLQLDCPV